MIKGRSLLFFFLLFLFGILKCKSELFNFQIKIAVLKDYRGRRYGAQIVNAVVAKSIEAGADRVYVDAQNHAVNFYEKLGFRICGTELIDRGIAHTPMCIDKGDFNVEE